MTDSHQLRRKVLVFGATGAIGRRLVPLLVDYGHAVVGVTREPSRVPLLGELGAQAVVVDVFDRDRVFAVVRGERPDALIHQLTDLSARDLVANARLRIEGTRNLVDAARSQGVRRIVAQSLAFAYAPGEGPAREDVPFDLDAPQPRRGTVAGVASLEQAAVELDAAVILRYGTLYGPGTWYASGGAIAAQVRRGELEATDGVTSFVHVEDAARAALLALAWPPGPVNIVDDEPAPGRVWLPVYADQLGAPPPRFRPGVARGERGASNVKARRQLGWQPLFPSWREGFATALG